MAIESTLSHQPSPSARMQGGVLILSLPDAIEPVLWKIDIAHYKNLALRVVRSQSDESEIFRLVSNIDNDFSDHVVANFSTKAAAVRAMMMAGDALEHMSPTQNTHSGAKNPPAPLPLSEKPTSAHNPWVKYVLKPLLYIVSVLIVSVILLFVFTQFLKSNDSGSSSADSRRQANEQVSGQVSGQPGQSISAEDFLRDR